MGKFGLSLAEVARQGGVTSSAMTKALQNRHTTSFSSVKNIQGRDGRSLRHQRMSLRRMNTLPLASAPSRLRAHGHGSPPFVSHAVSAFLACRALA